MNMYKILKEQDKKKKLYNDFDLTLLKVVSVRTSTMILVYLV